MNKNNRLLWPDVLKTGSIFSVILIHSAAPLLERYDLSGSGYWWTGNVYNSLVRWCIPVFFMISGAFLVENAGKESLRQFFSRRFGRIFIPFIVWSGIYFLWRVYGNGERVSFYSFPVLLLKEPVYYHLWFIYILIELYLLAPLSGVYVRHADVRNLLFFLTIWFVFGSVLPMVQSCCGATTFFSAVTSESVINYIGYFIIGSTLREYSAGRKMSVLLLVLFFISFFLTAYGTYYMTVIRNGGVFSDCFYDYFSVNVLIMSVSIFILVKSCRIFNSINLSWSSRHLSTVASAVPGVYFIHALVLAILKKGLLGITMSETVFGPVIGIPLFASVIFVVSLAIVLLVRSIPVVKRIVP
ncbi:MAG: acyltransferase family protein [Chitinispirillaceae bacterium]|nr:acyltransferase family protein [Chitinispirillaceae bacterium]